MSETIAPPEAVGLEEEHRLFEEYKAARARAEETGHWRDGLAAGRAWGRFIEAFDPRPPAPRREEVAS